MVQTPALCKGKTEAHFQAIGKVEEVMEEFINKQRGSQMTERASIRAEEGVLSIPVAHLLLGVEVNGSEGGRESKLGAKLEELTEAK